MSINVAGRGGEEVEFVEAPPLAFNNMLPRHYNYAK